MQDLHEILGAKEQIIRAAPSRHTPLRQATQRLSKRNIASAKAEVLNTALQRLTTLCYELEQSTREDAPPLAWNVDGRDGRILIGVPMGGRAYRQYGLRRQERDVLRAILVDVKASKGAPLYIYDTGKWYLNVYDYRTIQSAQGWLKDNRITATMWVHYLESTLRKP